MTYQCLISPVLAHSSPFLAVASGAGSTAGKRGPRLIVPCANERSNENLANRWHDRIPEAVPGFRSLAPLRSAKIGNLLITGLLLGWDSAVIYQFEVLCDAV